ncbi:damage-inducible protein DinB [Chryseobacterium indologenes]|uniref:DinB family protein n=1 Tax=Chryseobacterium indologenes TaxID=253 RepID=UPI0003E06F41|nr:DinB family protein [Chryseobacterium indologenes]ASE63235.1 damage-inducible protein DinB [Chryseobacterium indologenes]ATN07144.1 damage-inducible protein DinB [Chryseobacterium indologenes]AYY84108.1 damage-inducible protein DinB [Chryseobacterium indologenes]QIX81058.1 damage-inducible protein DinB [Chryseobacterium indologenes]QPQ53133.1 damage-inducible protein DinB [Chryseobacterium indologenes]
MDTLSQLKSELEGEFQTTKKFIDLFPEGKNDYAPHEKSMKLMPLATHLVEVFEWPNTILNTSELDFGKGEYQPTQLSTKEDLIKKLDDSYQAGKAALEKATEDNLNPSWTIKNNGHELASWSKYGAIRHALNQITHHRAQLGVYYRLNNIPLPGSYGPSADQQSF